MTQEQHHFLPYPVLPQENLSLPKLTKETLVLVIGGRGIAKAVALQFYALGAIVSVTSRDPQKYDRSGLPDDIRVFRLD